MSCATENIKLVFLFRHEKSENTNEGGYEASDLRKELQENSVLEIFDSVREMMVPFKNGDLLRIPYLHFIASPFKI